MYTWQVATYPRTLATGLCDYGVLRNACIETSGFADEYTPWSDIQFRKCGGKLFGVDAVPLTTCFLGTFP